ncbi:TPA: hypothetical protein ACS7ZY_001857 [Providencia alcalifaciens]
MINLKNKYEKLKEAFESYKEKIEQYEKLQKSHIRVLRDSLGKQDYISDKSISSLEQYIGYIEKNIKANQDKVSNYEIAVIKMGHYMDNIEYDDNLDSAVDFINQFQSILSSQPDENLMMPKGNILSSPFTLYAALASYNNMLEMTDEFKMLNAQYSQFSDVANETLQTMNGPRFSDCLNSYESETMMVEQMATLDSKDNSSVLSAFENSAVYGGCDIYLGYQYCV